jgi:hypothetical protein
MLIIANHLENILLFNSSSFAFLNPCINIAYNVLSNSSFDLCVRILILLKEYGVEMKSSITSEVKVGWYILMRRESKLGKCYGGFVREETNDIVEKIRQKGPRDSRRKDITEKREC